MQGKIKCDPYKQTLNDYAIVSRNVICQANNNDGKQNERKGVDCKKCLYAQTPVDCAYGMVDCLECCVGKQLHVGVRYDRHACRQLWKNLSGKITAYEELTETICQYCCYFAKCIDI